VHILEKGRQAIEDVTVELEAERAQQDPKVFTRIHMHFVVKGRRLASEKVERAIALSVEKYCSASAMIAKTATITHDFEVIRY
jgi:putative redox protein